MALTEKLALIVSAVGGGAIKEFTKIGAAARSAHDEAAKGAARSGEASGKLGGILGQLGVDSTVALKAGVAGAAVAAGAAVVKFGASAAHAASDLNEQISATKFQFGSATGEILRWSTTTASSLGIARTEALQAANNFGAFFDALKASPEVSAKLSKGMVQLAGDLASFRNLRVEDALEKLRSGLAGETEPLRSVGVFLNEASVNAKAAKLGLTEYNGSLTDGQKIVARYAVILDQTQKAHGDVARTSSSAANQGRQLSANFEDLKSSVGQAILPFINLGSVLLNVVLKALKPVGAVVAHVGGAIGKLTEKLHLSHGAGKQAEKTYSDADKALRAAAVSANQMAEGMQSAGDAADAAAKKVSDNARTAIGYAQAQLGVQRAGLAVHDAERRLAEARSGGAARAKQFASALKTVQRAQEDVEAATQGVAEAQRALDAALHGPDPRDLASAQLDVRDAQLELHDAQQALADVNKSGEASSDDYERAQVRVERATINLSRAQEEAGQIQSDSQNKIADAQRRVADAQKRAEDAAQSLLEANQKLAEARKPADVYAVQEAELALRDAQLGVIDAQLRTNDSFREFYNILSAGGADLANLSGLLSQLGSAGFAIPNAPAGREFSDGSFASKGPGGVVRRRASGGEIDGPAIVGEKGPELLVGRGRIIPNHQLGSNVTVNVNASGGADGQAIARAVRDELVRLRNRNGSTGL